MLMSEPETSFEQQPHLKIYVPRFMPIADAVVIRVTVEPFEQAAAVIARYRQEYEKGENDDG